MHFIIRRRQIERLRKRPSKRPVLHGETIAFERTVQRLVSSLKIVVVELPSVVLAALESAPDDLPMTVSVRFPPSWAG